MSVEAARTLGHAIRECIEAHHEEMEATGAPMEEDYGISITAIMVNLVTDIGAARAIALVQGRIVPATLLDHVRHYLGPLEDLCNEYEAATQAQSPSGGDAGD